MAASATVGILRVLLSANSAEFESAMKAAAKSADAFSKDMSSVSRQATNIGSTLTKALTVPLLGIAAASVKSATSFESSFAGIRKTVDGVVDSAGNLTAAGVQMQQAMRDLAKTIPVNVDALNRLGESAGALGIPRDKVVDFAKVMAELGVTTNLTADQAADAIARIQNIFGAAGQNTDRLASTLVALGNAGASTETEIVEMAQRIAGAGHTVGLTQAQVLAFASTLASVGINAEAGGSAISRVFLKINDAVAKGGSGLTEFARVAGMSAAQFKASFEKDAAGATQAFIKGIARLKASGENVNGTIEGLIGKNIILKDTLLRVSGAGGLLSDQLKLANQAWQDNTALTKEAEQRFKTTESQLALLWNRIKDVGITLGNALLPGIQAAISGFNTLLPVVDTLAKGFAALPGSVQLVVVGLGALAAAAGPALLVVGQLAGAAANVTAMFGKKGIATRLLTAEVLGLGGAAAGTATSVGVLGAAFALLTNPLVLVTAGAGLAALAIYSVATAETDLEKALKSNVITFRDHTKALGDALDAYKNLRDKQTLTKDESQRLGQATRLLAEASGLSVEAFKREAAQSSALTGELNEQLKKRKELYQASLDQARTAAADAAGAQQKAEAELKRLRSGETQKVDVVGLAGKVDVQTRAFSTTERQAEVERLTASIAKLKQQADEAKLAYQRMAGYEAKDINLPLEAVAASADKAGKSVSVLAQLNASYAEDLKKIGGSGFKEIQTAHESYGKSVKFLAEQYGVAESSIQHYFERTKKATAATKEAAKENEEANSIFDRFVKSAKNLEMELEAAANAGVPMSIVLEEFGNQIEDVTHKAPIFGQAVGDATKEAAAALDKLSLEKAAAKFKKESDRLVADLSDDARQMVEKWQKAGEDAGERLATGLVKSNKKFHDDAVAVQRDLIGLEKDSLEKRLSLIRLEFEERRRALDKNDAFYESRLLILNAEEAKALQAGTKVWKEEAEKRREAWATSLSGLAQSFSQLAEISGNAFGGIIRDIGQLVGSMNVALQATQALGRGIAAMRAAQTTGQRAQAGVQTAAAGVSLAGSLWESSNPEGKGTAQNIAQTAGTWAVAGAEIGSLFGPGGTVPGLVIGGIAGALVGWWRSSHQQWRQIGENVGDWLGAPISEKLAKQIDEVRKTLEGGTKQQRQEWAALISLPDIIAEQGGLRPDNIGVFEKQAKGLFEIIGRGGANAKQAYDTLNSLAGQFADYADTAGGMWDQTFKDLIAQSKALGINLKNVNKAIDAQVGKLSSGLGTAVSGAFADSDKRLADLTKSLTPDQSAALKSGNAETQTRAGIDPSIIAQYNQIQADTQDGFDRLSRIALASLNTIVASGQTAAQALTGDLGAAVDLLISKHDELGLKGGAAYDQLARQRGLVKNNEALIASVGGLNDVMTALSNLGGLNVDVLADLEGQGLETFAKLQAAGFTENEALQQMVPFLENVLKAHRDLGIPIDENTQRLIDQAEAQGLLSDEAISTNDILLAGFAALIKAVGGELPKAFETFGKSADAAARKAEQSAKDAEDAFAKIPSNKTITIDVDTTGVAPAFARFEADGTSAADAVYDGIDTVNFGHSPGGIKEIPIQLGLAGAAFGTFQAKALTPLHDVKDAVDGAANKMGDLSKVIGDLEVPPDFTVSIHGAMTDITGLAGITQSAVDDALGSVDSLSSGVDLLALRAQVAAGDVANVGNVIVGAFGNASLATDALVGKIGELAGALIVVPWETWGGRGRTQAGVAFTGVSELTGGVNALDLALTKSPWQAWAMTAVEAIKRVIASVSVLATSITNIPKTPTPGKDGSTTPTVPPIVGQPGGTTNGDGGVFTDRPGPFIPPPSRFPLPTLRALDMSTLGALSSGLVSSQAVAASDAFVPELRRTGTDDRTAAPVTMTLNVTVSGEAVNSQQRAREIGMELAREVNRGGAFRTQFRDLVGID